MKNETVNIGVFDSERALADLRAELDAIDGQLLETIRLRLDCCSRIGHLKKTVGIPMMQPQRVGHVLQRAEDFAVAHGLSAVFLRKIYATIIEETCRLEDLIIDGVPGDEG